MGIIDFTEIKSGSDWESFAQAFFTNKGFNIIEGPTTGGDSGTGKDLIIEEVKESEFEPIRRRFLVSCKHFANRKGSNSVKESDEKDTPIINLLAERCDGFVGFYSTLPSSSLTNKLRNIGKDNNKIIQFYDWEKVENYLTESKDTDTLFKRFFPKSYQHWKGLKNKDIDKNLNFSKLSKSDFQDSEEGYYKKYFEGQPANWNIIKKYTFKRDCFENVIKNLENNKISLITGAGGEGKSTFLMQIGEYYFNQNYEIYYSLDAIINIDLSQLKFNSNKKYLIIIDEANYIANLGEFIKKIKLSSNVLILLSARLNEWMYYLSNNNTKDLERWIGEPFNLGKLTETELKRLIDLLHKNEISVNNSDDLVKLSQSDSQFLLSIMLYITKGQSFEYIIQDVIKKISLWENGFLTLKAIAYISCFEVLGRGQKGHIYCYESLLQKLIDITNGIEYKKIKNNLAEEAFFQGLLKNTIKTRNPLIAQLYYKILLDDANGYFDKYDIYYDILREVSLSTVENKADILAMIPSFHSETNKSIAIELLKDAISFGYFFNQYIAFIHEEIKKQNFGSYTSDQYSVRWLFDKSHQKNSHNPQLFTQWGLFEHRCGNIGNIDEEYSARWIFNKGINQAPDSSLFSTWANIEANAGNIGNIDEEYSARWICNKGINQLPASTLYSTWANIESNAGNIGNIDEEYSARWICKEGIKNKPGSDLYSIWGTLEANAGNIGNIDEEYSARWICKEGIKNKPGSDLYSTWANIESNAGNIGNIDEEYSARWICKEGIKNKPSSGLYSIWGTLEANEGNIGNIDEEYSARWVFDRGINKNPSYDLFLAWGSVEYSLGNIGNIENQASAKGIWHSLYKELNVIAYKWIVFEAKENNIGDDNTPFSATWLFNKQKERRPIKIDGNTIQTLDELVKYYK